jgi:phospholipid transport system substrate-binding protein
MRSFLFLCVAAVLGFSAPAHAATVKEAEQFVTRMANEALSAIADKNLDKAKKQAKLEKILANSVDTKWIGKFVMGRFWKEATDAQKKAYLQEYDGFVIKHYASRFAEYTAGDFSITGSQDNGDDEFMVNMEIKTGEPGSEPVLVDYRVRHDGGFKVYDIIVEGVSMIQTQRSEFTSLLNSKGIDHLIQQLANKTLTPPAAKSS